MYMYNICMYNIQCKGMVYMYNHYPQREILDILYSVFQLKVPTWTDNFQVAIASIG